MSKLFVSQTVRENVVKPHTLRYQQESTSLQNTLVDVLKSKGYIRTSRIESAFRTIPRHLFVPDSSLEDAYSNRALLVKQDVDGQWISSSSSPGTMAMMLEQLGLKPGHEVLEIGAGTGYNAAVMAHLVGKKGHVVTLDIDEDIVKEARCHLSSAGLVRVEVIRADGGYGYGLGAPYDRIILTVGASDILPVWRDQLKPNGRLLLPLSITWSERSVAFEKKEDFLLSRSVCNCSFMRLRGDFPGITWTQLGPEPGLVMGCNGIPEVDAEKVYTWLTGTWKDWETGVEATLGEVIFGLELWISLHKPEIRHVLTAQGDMADRNIVPSLVFGDVPKSVTTGVLIGQKGMVALMRPADRRSPFPLIIRQFGSEEALVHQVLEHIRSWEAAGRPSSKGLHIRAYPKDSTYVPKAGEFLIEKKWTKFILDWHNKT